MPVIAGRRVTKAQAKEAKSYLASRPKKKKTYKILASTARTKSGGSVTVTHTGRVTVRSRTGKVEQRYYTSKESAKEFIKEQTIEQEKQRQLKAISEQREEAYRKEVAEYEVARQRAAYEAKRQPQTEDILSKPVEEYTVPRRKEAEETIDRTDVPISPLPPSKLTTWDKPKTRWESTTWDIRKWLKTKEISEVRRGIADPSAATWEGYFGAGAGLIYPFRSKESTVQTGKIVLTTAAVAASMKLFPPAAPYISATVGAVTLAQLPRLSREYQEAKFLGPVAQREFLAEKGVQTIAAIGGAKLGFKLAGGFQSWSFARRTYTKPTEDPWRLSTETQKSTLRTKEFGFAKQDIQTQLIPKRQVITPSPKQQPLKTGYFKDYWPTEELGMREYLGKYTEIPGGIETGKIIDTSGAQFKVIRNLETGWSIKPMTDYFTTQAKLTDIYIPEKGAQVIDFYATPKGQLETFVKSPSPSTKSFFKIFTSKKGSFYGISETVQVPKPTYKFESLLGPTPGKAAIGGTSVIQSKTYFGSSKFSGLFYPTRDKEIIKTDFYFDIKSRQRQQPKIDPFVGLAMAPKVDIFPKQTSRLRLDVTPRKSTRGGAKPKQKTIDKITPIFPTVPRTKTPTRTTTTPPPIIPGMPIFRFGMPRRRQTVSLFRPQKQPKRYQPQASAILLNIKGRAPKSTITGFEFRPLPIKKKKGRAKKKKSMFGTPSIKIKF